MAIIKLQKQHTNGNWELDALVFVGLYVSIRVFFFVNVKSRVF